MDLRWSLVLAKLAGGLEELVSAVKTLEFEDVAEMSVAPA